MEFLKATIKDVQTLLDIEKTTEGLRIYSGYFTEKEIAEWISNDIVYLIKDNGQLVGSVSYEIKDKDHAYISGLVIKTEFRKQGLGRKAMQKLLEELKNYRKIDLVTHPENIAAIKIYKSLGFDVTDKKENFFGDGKPRIVMVKISDWKN
jgi:ribosomal protein S18 acetylase RimI-like enzyme